MGKIERRAMTPSDVEIAYSIPRGSLANMRWRRVGPRYFKTGKRKVIYLVSDIEAWIAKSPVQTIDSIGE